MPAPLLWIILPAAMAAVLFLLSRYQQLVRVAGTFSAAALTWMAWRIPIDAPVELGPFSIKLSETLTILGRRFILDDADRPLLGLIYLLAALWFSLSWMAEAGPLFVPVGLGMVTLLTAVLAVDPFLFAALFLEIAALLSIPILTVPGRSVGRGVLRFLTYQTLGVPFILFTGWMLAGLEASPGEVELVVRASVLLGMGFAFLLALFPFHAWVPMLAAEAPPFLAGFLFLMLFLMIPLFGISFLDRFIWLRNSPQLLQLLQWSGLLMVTLGGVWAAFERHLGRIFGFAVLIEVGLGLLAVSLGIRQGVALFFGLIPQRALGFLVWSLALAMLLAVRGSLKLTTAPGLARQAPALAAALLIAHLAATGFPPLAGFPARLPIWGQLAGEGIWVLLLSFSGSVGLMVAWLRTLRVLVLEGPAEEGMLPIPTGRRVLLSLGGASLLLLGLLYGSLQSWILELAGSFSTLIP